MNYISTHFHVGVGWVAGMNCGFCRMNFVERVKTFEWKVYFDKGGFTCWGLVQWIGYKFLNESFNMKEF